MLPKITLPEPPFKLEMDFGFSNSASDWDNPIKPLQDILQKKYNFNDKDVFEAHIRKFKVSKGNDYLKFKITSL
jgi:Holliday junction resolvase RusA-like endonuclease